MTLDLDPLIQRHDLDAEGCPAGGSTTGRGFAIVWQDGPLAGDVAPEECVNPHHLGSDLGGHDASVPSSGPCRRSPNGAFVEDIIRAAIGRLEHYQGTEFACERNATALLRLWDALDELAARTAERHQRGVEGTHEP